SRYASALIVLFLIIPRSPRSTLFPYTTLFRSFSNKFGSKTLQLAPRCRRQRPPPVHQTQQHMDCSPMRNSQTLQGRIHSGRSARSEEHTSELQSPDHLVCRLLLEKKNPHTAAA